MSDVSTLPRVLPEMVELHRIAKELRKASHVLVDASARGQFPPVVKVGAVWYVDRAKLADWFGRNHATLGDDVTPLELDRIRAAGQAGASALPAPRQRQPRGRKGASS